MKENNRRFAVARWILMSLAILSNGFLIAYSCLSNEATIELNRIFANSFTAFINSFTKGNEKETIPLNSLEIDFSNDKYNDVPGYDQNEIPLGSAKEIDCGFSPTNATDKSISYSVEPNDALILNQTNSKVSAVGMKTGKATVTATNSISGLSSSIDVYVVDTVAPVQYDISLSSTTIPIGTTQTIEFDIDGGVLTHDDLINFRYYDTRKLSFSSLDEHIVTVDSYGVIHPHNIGSTSISVSNDKIIRTLNVSVSSGSTPAPISDLSISGSHVCYENDMLLDQRTKTNHFQLTPKSNDEDLNPEDFVWESSNELLAKVDRNGILRGFRKTTTDDETVTISAKSKITGEIAYFEAVVKSQLPSMMDVYLEAGSQSPYNPTEYTLFVGDNITCKFVFDVNNSNTKVIAVSSDDTIVSLTNSGNIIILHVLNEGKCRITYTSSSNPKLIRTIDFTVFNRGAIDSNSFGEVEYSIRKTLGHAVLFMIAQIFTFLTLYMFLYDKKWWFYTSISLGVGLSISCLSELIQFFIPLRTGSFVDVLIDFAGVVVGAALSFLSVWIILKLKKRAQNKKMSHKSE